MKDFLIAFIIGFIMGAGLTLSMAKHESAKLQMQFGQIIVAMETGK
jgi:hypothetical protein